MSFTIKVLSPFLIEDYIQFFDQMVFSEHPHWSKCYCYSYHFTGADAEWSKEENRQAVIKLIQEGKMKGFLAYEENRLVGWCNANNKMNFQSFGDQDPDSSEICSIVCFLIHPDYRRKGIAQKLLEQAIAVYSQKDCKYIEAYPRKDKHSCERNYHGHFSLYEKFNFKVEEEFNDYYVVRKRL